MNGNFARSILCSLVTSVDFGWYSSIVGVRSCEDCFCGATEDARRIAAPRGQKITKIARARITAKNAGVSQVLIVSPLPENCPSYLPTESSNGWLAISRLAGK